MLSRFDFTGHDDTYLNLSIGKPNLNPDLLVMGVKTKINLEGNN